MRAIQREEIEEKKGLASEEIQKCKSGRRQEGDSTNPKVDSSTLAVSKETDASEELQKNIKVVEGEEEVNSQTPSRRLSRKMMVRFVFGAQAIRWPRTDDSLQGEATSVPTNFGCFDQHTIQRCARLCCMGS